MILGPAPLSQLAHLAPDHALLLFTAGTALVTLETNRPGLILPGAIGLTCILLALADFAHQPVTAAGAVLALTGLALLCLSFLRSLPLLVPLAGTVAFALGLCRLLPAGVQPPLHRGTALGCALLIGLGFTLLAQIAQRARRAKGLD